MILLINNTSNDDSYKIMIIATTMMIIIIIIIILIIYLMLDLLRIGFHCFFTFTISNLIKIIGLKSVFDLIFFLFFILLYFL
jgi:hypothetical protein